MKLGVEICEALGLDPKAVSSVDIHVEAGMLTADVTVKYCFSTIPEGVGVALKKYDLVEKE